LQQSSLYANNANIAYKVAAMSGVWLISKHRNQLCILEIVITAIAITKTENQLRRYQQR
jgi:hypothetical protein